MCKIYKIYDATVNNQPGSNDKNSAIYDICNENGKIFGKLWCILFSLPLSKKEEYVMIFLLEVDA